VATRNSTVTDEDLAKQQATVEKLREQVADAERTRLDRERSQHNAIRMAELQAEEARLTAQLASARDAAKAGSVQQGAAAPLEAARADLAVAQEQAAATQAATDTSGKGE
jgi:hypothetical protein